MTLLRHPVVITSLEEDFRKIGLITDDDRDEGVLQEDRDEEGTDFDDEVYDLDDDDEETSESIEDEDDDDEDAAMAEAVAFHATAKSVWQELGEAGVETITLDEADMDELESMAAESTTLPAGIIDESIDEDDEDDEIDEDDEVEEDDSEGPAPFAAVAEAMNAIESILAEGASAPTSIEDATPAFANLALISEKLYGFYTETAESQDDTDYAEIAESFKGIAQYSAAIVDTLQTEDPATIDTDVLTETFQDYLGTVLKGLETYAILREMEEDEPDEDSDEDSEVDEDAEGND